MHELYNITDAPPQINQLLPMPMSLYAGLQSVVGHMPKKRVFDSISLYIYIIVERVMSHLEGFVRDGASQHMWMVALRIGECLTRYIIIYIS